MQAKRPLRILIIDTNDDRAAVVKEGLASQGDAQILRINELTDVVEQIRRHAPDVIIVDCDSPDRDTLESMRDATAERPRPIIMFVEESRPNLAEEAIRAGVTAYIVDGLSPKRVKPVLDVAISRFKIFQALRDELQKAKADLAGRKVIERAKGILMDQRKIGEEEAYKLLRNSAMKEGKAILEIADAIVSVSHLLKG